MPAQPPVKELPAARPRGAEHVLEIGSRGGGRADDGAVQRTAPQREQRDAGNAARDLEAPARDVLVRDPVAEQVRRRPEQRGGHTRAREGAERRTGGHVQRDDHRRLTRSRRTRYAKAPAKSSAGSMRTASSSGTATPFFSVARTLGPAASR